MNFYSANTHWIWGLALTVLCVTIHVAGVVSLALAGIRLRSRIQVRHLGLLSVMPIVIAVLAAIGLMLTICISWKWRCGGLVSADRCLQLTVRRDAFLARRDDDGRRAGAGATAPVANAGGARGRKRRSPLRH